MPRVRVRDQNTTATGAVPVVIASGIADARLRRVVATLAVTPGPLVLAVSGGIDSMVLLDLAAREPSVARRLTVATFDHGTGQAARRAVRLVRREAAARALPVVVGRASPSAAGTEAGWREARWAFLRRVAARLGARVVTAHTQNDQVETVVLRLLRGAGARGLAGLAAPSPIVRPMLAIARGRIRRYARAHDIRVVRDPSNRSMAHGRNRVRLELLPAIARVDPTFAREMIVLGRRAARWRRDLEAIVDRMAPQPTPGRGGGVRIASRALAGYDLPALCVLWPAVAARAGAVLDRRGTRRLSAFTTSAGTGARMPLSGGWEVVRAHDAFVLRRAAVGPPPAEAPLVDGVRWGSWRFRNAPAAADPDADDPWIATLPRDGRLVVRGWQAGDRVRATGRSSARRVKRYFMESRIAGPERHGWPVVLLDDEIVWVPGVCRSDAATVRSGRSGRAYRCERS